MFCCFRRSAAEPAAPAATSVPLRSSRRPSRRSATPPPAPRLRRARSVRGSDVEPRKSSSGLRISSTVSTAAAAVPDRDVAELGEASADFVGNLGRVAAEDRLKGQPPFTFLLRVSSQGVYCVSFVTKSGDRCEHALIQRATDRGYRLGVYKKEFPRIPDLLRYYGFSLTADAGKNGTAVVYEILLPDDASTSASASASTPSQPTQRPLASSTASSSTSGSRVSTRASSRRRPSRALPASADASSGSNLRPLRRLDSIDITQQACYPATAGMASSPPAATPVPTTTSSSSPLAAVHYSTLGIHNAVTTRVLRSSDGAMSAANFDRLEPNLRVSETAKT